MKASARICLLAVWLSTGSSAAGADHPELRAFPPAARGMQRFVIVLPHKERREEGQFKVELVTGKTTLTDGINQVRLGNRIEPRPLKGWGYKYYEVTGPSHTMSTLMAPPDDTPQVEQFVSAAPLQIRYNSRLPVVVFAPEGYEVRYRIWQASENWLAAPQG